MIECIIEEDVWRDVKLSELARCTAKAVFSYFEMPEEGFHISLLGCNDQRITSLNAQFRGQKKATNVLSWPSVERSAYVHSAEPKKPKPGTVDQPEELGDIAISYETCLSEARDAKLTISEHASHLIVHAILHLLGYDHINDTDAKLMEHHEIAVLAKLGISNPY